MKTKIFFILICNLLICNLQFAQNITNTLGSVGVFKIKDGATDFFTLTQSTGQVNILKTLRLENTTSSTKGIIFKGTDRFIHNYKDPGISGHNVFIGINSGNFTLTGTFEEASYNTAVGDNTLTSNTSGHHNVAIGWNSLTSNTSGYWNTGVGNYALTTNTTGFYNTAIGMFSLYNNLGGFYNTAVGKSSLLGNNSGNYNTGVGVESLNANTNGSNNTAMGYQSLYLNNGGNYNTALGMYSLFYNVIGYYNTSVGNESLFNNTGNNNTALGYFAGYNIGAGSNLMCLGNNSQPTTGSATNQITLGNSAVTSLRCAVTTITALSDARDKKNITDLNLGINFLMKLKPRLYNWDKREWYEDNVSDGTKMQEAPTAGFIAQELDEVQTTENAEWLNLVLKDNPDKWEATPGNLFPIVVKAIQDLKTENDGLKTACLTARQENSELKERLSKLEQMQNVLAVEIEKMKSKDTEVKEVKLGENKK